MKCTTKQVGNPGIRLVHASLMLGLLAALTMAVTDAREEPDAVVEMTNKLTFEPTEVTIGVGETVEWHNTSLLTHTVTADPNKATLKDSVQLPKGAKPFDSGNLDPGDTFLHTFNVAGTYRYFCIPHEGAKMRGTVVVK